jgi:hypothetical protein
MAADALVWPANDACSGRPGGRREDSLGQGLPWLRSALTSILRPVVEITAYERHGGGHGFEVA